MGSFPLGVLCLVVLSSPGNLSKLLLFFWCLWCLVIPRMLEVLLNFVFLHFLLGWIKVPSFSFFWRCFLWLPGIYFEDALFVYRFYIWKLCFHSLESDSSSSAYGSTEYGPENLCWGPHPHKSGHVCRSFHPTFGNPFWDISECCSQERMCSFQKWRGILCKRIHTVILEMTMVFASNAGNHGVMKSPIDP